MQLTTLGAPARLADGRHHRSRYRFASRVANAETVAVRSAKREAHPYINIYYIYIVLRVPCVLAVPVDVCVCVRVGHDSQVNKKV